MQISKIVEEQVENFMQELCPCKFIITTPEHSDGIAYCKARLIKSLQQYMKEEPQTKQVTIVFTIKHSPGDNSHLEQVLLNYFAGKGCNYKDGIITI